MNNNAKYPDVHEPYVRPLIAAGDWAALVRYWIAHQYETALDWAITCARLRVEQDGRWEALPDYLTEVKAAPLNPEVPPPQSLMGIAEEAEAATLMILKLYPLTALCEMAQNFPAEHQSQLFELGMQSSDQAMTLAERCADLALLAFFMVLRAGGLKALNQLEEARRSFEEALDLYRELAAARPEVYRAHVAMTLNNLGTVQSDLNQLEEARRSFEEALDLYRELAAVRPEVYRPDVAMTLNNLGTVQRALNQLEQARRSYEEALTIRRELAAARPEVYRAHVAMTLNNLGTVQSDLNQLEEARRSFEEALTIRRELAAVRPEVYRAEVAMTLNNLGTVQRALNQLEEARRSYKEALDLYRELAAERPEVYWPDVAMTLNNLGNVQRDLNLLEQARRSFEEALDLYRKLAAARPEVYRAHVAMTLNNLGTVQSDLNQLEEARRSFEEALTIRRELAAARPEVYRPDVAMTLNNLGNVQRDLNLLEQARRSFEEALDLYRKLAAARPEVYRAHVAMTLNNLGTVQSDLNQLEEARRGFEEALELFRELAAARPEVYRPDVAMTLNNLGNVQRALNQLEEARRSYEKALDLYRELAAARPEVYRAHVAMTLNNLGNVQSDLNLLEEARRSYEEALELYRKLAAARPEVYRPDVAMTLNNLGNVQRDLNQLEEARRSFEEALTIRRELAAARPEVYRPDVAMTLNNLGNVQSNLNQLEEARWSYEEALDLYRKLAAARPEVYRAHVAMTLNNLGNVQRALNQLEQARRSFEEAIGLYEIERQRFPTAHLADRGMLWLNLGRLLLTESVTLGWPLYGVAREALRAAVVCAEQIRGGFKAEALRKGAQERGLEAYDLLVRTCVDLWDVEGDIGALQEAVEVAERSRARNLMDRLHGTELNPAHAPAGLAKQFHELRRQLELARLRLDAAGRAGQGVEDQGGSIRGTEPGTRLPSQLAPGAGTVPAAPKEAVMAALQAEVERLEREHARQLAELRVYDPDYSPEGLAAMLSFAQIQALVPTDVPTAFVQFKLTSTAAIILVTTRTGVFAIRLKEGTDQRVWELAQQWFGKYYQGRTGPKLEHWEALLPGLLAAVGELINPLVAGLAQRGVSEGRLVLSPNRALHVFPLHACPINATGVTLGEQFEIVYTPSLSVLGQCGQRDRSAGGDHLVVGNPTGDLLFTEVEMTALRRHYPGSKELTRQQATKAGLLAAAGSSWLLHYSGHAKFNLADPLASGLLLSDHQTESLLTLREVFAGLNLRRNYLTILNGCESGMLLPDAVDEYVTLPSGFIYAGAVCVVSTLWVVHDLSAALLMDRFHTQWRQGRTVAAALREAARWLREDIRDGNCLSTEVLPEFLKHVEDPILRKQCERSASYYAACNPHAPPFASPVHWAPFVATGLAYGKNFTEFPK